MNPLKVFFLFLIFKYGACLSFRQIQLVRPCKVEDVKCVRKTTRLFLESTSSGLPQFGIKPVDPIWLSEVTVQDGQDLTLRFTNVTIHGLKGLRLRHYKLDTTLKYVFLKTKQELTINSNLEVEQMDKSKKTQGTFAAKGYTLCTVNYNYNITKDTKGVEHFDVGPEKINCYAVPDPYIMKVTLSDDLEKVLGPEERRLAVKKLTEKAYANFIHNIRTVAKLLPRKAFFSNI